MGFANPADNKFPLRVWPVRLPEKALCVGRTAGWVTAGKMVCSKH